MANQIQYTINRDFVGQPYQDLTITVTSQDSNGWEKGSVKFSWYRSEQNLDLKWYGFSMDASADTLAQLNANVKVTRRVLDSQNPYNKPTPREMLDKLERVRAIRTVYDARISRSVPIDEVQSPDYQAYIEDYETLGKGGASAHVMARDDDEAKRLIILQLAENRHTEERLMEWLQAGKPVIAHRYNNSAPDVRSVEELIVLPELEEEEEKTEELTVADLVSDDA